VIFSSVFKYQFAKHCILYDTLQCESLMWTEKLSVS